MMGTGEGMEIQAHLRAAALEVSPVAQVVLDAGGRVITINAHARSLLGFQPGDVGPPPEDLQRSYPVDLRSVIERVEIERRTVVVKDVEWRTPGGDLRCLDVSVTPVMSGDDRIQGMLVTFTDTTALRRLQQEVEQSHLELQSAYREIQSTNEELGRMNDELQSTTVELKTMNEELQSTNEQLETINDQVRQRRPRGSGHFSGMG